MSDKNFMSYGDAETVLTGFANGIKELESAINNASQSKKSVLLDNAPSGYLYAKSEITFDGTSWNTITGALIAYSVIGSSANIEGFISCNANVLDESNGFCSIEEATGVGIDLSIAAVKPSKYANKLTLYLKYKNYATAGARVILKSLTEGVDIGDITLTASSTGMPSAWADSTTIERSIKSLPGKTDKVASATNGHFAGLDASGNLTDSGKAASDFATPADILGTQKLVKDTVGWTGKNKLSYSMSPISDTDFTVTVNDDKSITFNGTCKGSKTKTIVRNFGVLDVDHILSIGNALGNKAYIRMANTSGTSYTVGGNTQCIIPAGTYSIIELCINNGFTADNLTIYPMLRRSDISDETYEPYHKTVKSIIDGIGTNPPMTKTRYTISSGSWSASANASGYYTYTITLTSGLNSAYAPEVWPAGSAYNVTPTDTEKQMYDLLEYGELTAATTYVLYAKTKPTSTFYVFIAGVASDVVSPEGEVYSTTETKIGKWIDGKDLFRIVMEITLPNASGVQRYLSSITGVETPIRWGGVVIKSSNEKYILPKNDINISVGLSNETNNPIVVIANNIPQYYYGCKAYITADYTKS